MLPTQRPLSSISLKNLLQKPKQHIGTVAHTDASFHHGDGKWAGGGGVNTNNQRHRSLGQRVTGSTSSSNHIKIVSPFDPLGHYTSGRLTGASGRGTANSAGRGGRVRCTHTCTYMNCH